MGLFNYLDLVSLLGPLNRFYDLYTGGASRPVFHDIDATRPELRTLDRGFPAIREELMALMPGKREIPRYHDLDPMQSNISAAGDPERSWKIFYLHAMGDWPMQARAACPRTVELLEHIPGLFQAFFSILDAGKSIPAHEGPYRGYLRYHLGLVVPEQAPPSIRIKDRDYTWREGQSILFDDSWDHEVTNRSGEDRVVLIVDIRRPMPFPFGATNRVVQEVMRRLYGRAILKRLA
jgi:aspartate beta-hydroxylase/beta-hydroxylase